MPQTRRLHLNKRGPRQGYGVGSAAALVACHQHRYLAGTVWLESEGRNVAAENHLQSYRAGVLDTVGKILDEFRAEVIVSPVTQGIGYSCACHTQRIGAVARIPLSQIAVGTGDGINHAADGCFLRQEHDCVHGVFRSGIHTVAYRRLPGILTLHQLVGGRAGKEAVVVENLLNHVGAYLRAHIAHQHRLLYQFVVEPALESAGRIVPVVVHP